MSTLTSTIDELKPALPDRCIGHVDARNQARVGKLEKPYKVASESAPVTV